MKQCILCNELKDLTLFHKNKYSSDGLLNKCGSCVKEYVKNLKEGVRMNPDDRLTQFQQARRKGVETEKRYAYQILTDIGYDVEGELSIHQQFLQKYNLT